jgi:hypothetical protein
VAPSDFFLFGESKRQLKGESYTSVNDLEIAIRSILHQVPAKVLKCVFDDWIAKCRALSASDGRQLATE